MGLGGLEAWKRGKNYLFSKYLNDIGPMLLAVNLNK